MCSKLLSLLLLLLFLLYVLELYFHFFHFIAICYLYYYSCCCCWCCWCWYSLVITDKFFYFVLFSLSYVMKECGCIEPHMVFHQAVRHINYWNQFFSSYSYTQTFMDTLCRRKLFYVNTHTHTRTNTLAKILFFFFMNNSKRHYRHLKS